MRHLAQDTRLLCLLLLDGSLSQSALKVNDARFQLLDAASLPVHRLEKAVECFPDKIAHRFAPDFHCMSQALKSHCFIRETVYHGSLFVASIKQSLASKIFLWYVLGVEWVLLAKNG